MHYSLERRINVRRGWVRRSVSVLKMLLYGKFFGSFVSRNMTTTPQRKFGWYHVGLAGWLVLFALLLAMHWYPIRFGTLRLMMVIGVALWWLGVLGLSWRYQAVKRIVLAASAVLILFLILPARSADPQKLRQEYVHALQSYEGTTYVWGGESRRGIDCSGLMRCALIDTNVRMGLTTFNPGLLREAFALWWNDSSAKAMKEEFQEKTRLIQTSPGLNQLDHSTIKPGDMAVTSNGVHVMAYVGNQTWIEADPSELQGNKVVQVKLPSRIAWFGTPVHLMRWRQLEAAGE